MPAVLPLNRGALETKECDASRNNISNDAGSSSDGCKGDDDRFETFIADVSYFTFNTKYLTQTTMQTVSSSLAIALADFEASQSHFHPVCLNSYWRGGWLMPQLITSVSAQSPDRSSHE